MNNTFTSRKGKCRYTSLGKITGLLKGKAIIPMRIVYVHNVGTGSNKINLKRESDIPIII